MFCIRASLVLYEFKRISVLPLLSNVATQTRACPSLPTENSLTTMLTNSSCLWKLKAPSLPEESRTKQISVSTLLQAESCGMHAVLKSDLTRGQEPVEIYLKADILK